MTTESTALALYNGLFNNRLYREVTQTLADALHVERTSREASDAANCITDAALSLCGHPHHTEACQALTDLCVNRALHDETVDLLHAYLRIFQQPGEVRADDLAATVKARLRIRRITADLPDAVMHAGDIHSWRGRTAYDLLAAADYLIRAAEASLTDERDSYIAEKIQHGIQRILGAIREAHRHSDTPSAYDFPALPSA